MHRIGLHGVAPSLVIWAFTFSIATFAAPAVADEVKSTPAPHVAPPPTNATHVVCTKERPIGSMIPRKRCRTVGQAEKERQGARDMMRSLNSGANGPIDGEHGMSQ